MDDVISRIDNLLDDDEPLDDWAYPWSDAWRWAPHEVELPERCWDDQDDRELDSGWEYHPDTQIHAIPVEQVAEWTACLASMPVAEREDVDWYVVCHAHKTVGERSVSCGCRPDA